MSSQYNNDSKPKPVYLWGESDRLSPGDLLDRLQHYHGVSGLEVDHFSLGGTVKCLEDQMASLLGKESAIFMPTGTLANHLALRHLCHSQKRVIVPEQSHIYNDTGDGLENLSGLKLIPLGKNRVCFSLNELRNTVKNTKTGRVDTPIGALVIESPVRRKQGQVVPYSDMQRITEYCRRNSIACHLDGARILMMSAATKVSITDYTKLFDTVYVSLYKYLNSPSGAILAGPTSLLKPMIQSRRMFGGALWGSYFFAALALEELTTFEKNYKKAFSMSQALFYLINNLPGISITAFKNGSNIFLVKLSPSIHPAKFKTALSEHAIYLDPNQSLGHTFTINVNTSLLRQSKERIIESTKHALHNAALEDS